MRLAIDIRHLASPNPSGIGRYTIELLKRIPSMMPDVDFLLFASGTAETLRHLPVFESDNVTVQKHEMPNRILSARMRYGKLKIEDLLASEVDAWWFPNTNIIRTELPYALTVHDISFFFFPEFFSSKTRLWHRLCKIPDLIQSADTLLSVSNHTAFDLVSFFAIEESKIRTTHLGASEEYQPRQRPEDHSILRQYGIKQPYFLSLSTIEPRKNIESIIDGFIAWKSSEASNTKLILAGKRGFQSKRILSKIWNRDDIIFLHYVKESHKPALYRHADLFFFPSYYEGFGLPVLEAMQSGVRTICSYTSSLPEITRGQALLVNPYDVTDVTRGIDAALEMPAPKRLPFNWDSTAKKTTKALYKLLQV